MFSCRRAMAGGVKGTQVTLKVPDGAEPGTLLNVPVRGGTSHVQVPVPQGVGPGSKLVLTQAAGSEEWALSLGDVIVPWGDAPGSPPVPQEPEEPEEEMPAAPDHLDPASRAHAQLSAPPGDPVAFTVRLNTTVGVLDVIVRPDWAPKGTQRFLELARCGDIADLAFYRAVKGCLVQFGLPPKRVWPPIEDDPSSGVPFLLGAIGFAAVGPNTRKSTLFICTGDMSHMLGSKPWEVPIGAIAESSLDVLDRIDTTYGDIAEFGGKGPDTARINAEGNAYLRANFPGLTYIQQAFPIDWSPSNGRAQPRADDSSVQLSPADLADQAATEAEAQALYARRAAELVQRAVQANDLAEAQQQHDEARRAADLAAAALRAAQEAEHSARAARQAAQAARQHAAAPLPEAKPPTYIPPPHAPVPGQPQRSYEPAPQVIMLPRPPPGAPQYQQFQEGWPPRPHSWVPGPQPIPTLQGPVHAAGIPVAGQVLLPAGAGSVQFMNRAPVPTGAQAGFVTGAPRLGGSFVALGNAQVMPAPPPGAVYVGGHR